LNMLSKVVRDKLPPVALKLDRAGDASMLLAERDNDEHSTDIEEQYLKAIRAAKQRITLANAYFYPSYRFP